MKKAMLAVLFLSFAGAIAAVPAFCQTVDYTNFTAHSDTGAPYYAYAIYQLNAPGSAIHEAASDSFTLASSATVDSVIFDYWLYDQYSQYGPLGSIDWSIGTSAYGASLGSGTEGPASVDYLNQIYVTANSTYYDIYSVSISIPDIALGPGTYWLTLGGVTTGDSVIPASMYVDGFWDTSDGASTAYSTTVGSSITVPSETFEILGTGGAVSTPEGGSGLLYLAMAGTLCLGCIVAVKRSRLSQLSPESYADSQ